MAKKKTPVSIKAEIKGVERNLGHLAFIAGVIVAIIAGIATDVLVDAPVTLVLVILGIIVGFMNITAKETVGFLVASVALMVAGVADVIVIPQIGIYLQKILENIATFVAPAAVVVALKTVYKLAEA